MYIDLGVIQVTMIID